MALPPEVGGEGRLQKVTQVIFTTSRLNKKKVAEGVKNSEFLGDVICERSLIIRNIIYLIIDNIFRAVPEKIN